MLVADLRFHIHRLEAIQRIHHRRQHQLRRVGARETAVAIDRPLHWRAHAIAVAQMDVVAHTDFVAVIQHRRARHGQQQRGHQLDTAAVALQQRRQAAPNAEIDTRAAIGGVGLPQIIAFRIGDHFQRQLIVVAQEDRPLAALRNLRGLAHDVGDGEAVFARDRHVHARHQREVKRHVAFVGVLAEVLLGVFRPHVGFCQQHAVRVFGIQRGADLAQDGVGFGQVFVGSAGALDQVRHRVQTQAIHAAIQPETHHFQHRVQHGRVIEVQVRLMRIEAVPEVLPGHRVPGPVGFFGIAEDDPRAFVFLVGVRPDVEVALGRAGWRIACALKPGMLIGGVVDHQLGNDADATRMRMRHQVLEVFDAAVIRVHRHVLGDVVAVIAARAGIERQQPDGVHAELGDVIQLGNQPRKIADAIVVGIEERLDVHLVDDRVLVPTLVGDHGRLLCVGL